MAEKTYTLKDFNPVTWVSNDGEYMLSKDQYGYIYPCSWYYTHPEWPKTKESGNFWSIMVNVSYDYSFTYKGALEVLNMELAGTWKRGEGRYLNGLPSEK